MEIDGKEARFLYDTEEIIAAFPLPAKRKIGYAIRLAQEGRKAEWAHPLTGFPEFKGAKVYETCGQISKRTEGGSHVPPQDRGEHPTRQRL